MKPRSRRPSTDSRRYPKRPILGVGAVIVRGDRVLLVQRGREPLKGYWSLPGGVLEVGETLERAVVREAKEETGLDIVPIAVVGIFERLMLDESGRPEYHYVLVDFQCRAGAGAPRAGGDAIDVRWVRGADLGRYQLTEDVLEAIHKAVKLRRPARAK
jgi:ADP-ribose pyrophosphatase YjhB (NUDIX family)